MNMHMKNVKKNSPVYLVNSTFWDLPSPSTMNYFWNMGATLGIVMAVQIVSGLMLTMHYTSYAEESFTSVIMIMKETWSGWIIRLMHMNGASLFFMAIYLHMARSLYFSSYKNYTLWSSGVTILILLMAISFMGYVLPWGQMSYWAVAVITNLFSIIPVVGENLVQWIWGGFNVSSPTLIRFYSLHFLLPFILSAAVLVHLTLLHKNGSNNPMGTSSDMDKIHFHPYFTTKDIQFILTIFALMMTVSLFKPYMFGDPVNMMPANPMQTPLHIQPEWYFLTSYTILRAMPSKVAGVLALLASVMMYYILPLMKSKFSSKFKLSKKLMYWTFLSLFAALTKLGAMEAEEPYTSVAKMMSLLYFSSLTLMALYFG